MGRDRNLKPSVAINLPIKRHHRSSFRIGLTPAPFTGINEDVHSSFGDREIAGDETRKIHLPNRGAFPDQFGVLINPEPTSRQATSSRQ